MKSLNIIPSRFLKCFYSSTSPTISPITIQPTVQPSSQPSTSLSPSTDDIITTIAGTGTTSYSGDNGHATSASLYNPFGIALDSTGTNPHLILVNKRIFSFIPSGNVYIGDYFNHRVRKVTVTTGIITTFAGNGTGSAGTGKGSYGGDNGQATSAGLNNPRGVALDTSGSFRPKLVISFFSSVAFTKNFST